MPTNLHLLVEGPRVIAIIGLLVVLHHASVSWPRLLGLGGDGWVVPLEGLPAPWFDPHVGVIMQSWAEVNGCDPQAIEESYTKNVTRYRWSNCEAKTEWYLIEGGGHAWPGGSVREDQSHTAPEISASEMIWDFFFEANQSARSAPVG